MRSIKCIPLTMCLLCVTLLNCRSYHLCFMESLVNQSNKRYLNYNSFYYTNLSFKCLKLTQDQIKTYIHRFIGSQRSPIIGGPLKSQSISKELGRDKASLLKSLWCFDMRFTKVSQSSVWKAVTTTSYYLAVVCKE